MNLSRFSMARTYVRATHCRYTVVLQCCDPPQPCAVFNTNDESEANKAFEDLVQNEINEGGGGEFRIVMWDHNWFTSEGRRSPIETMRIEDERPVYVYNISYPESKTVKEFSYMDLAKHRLGETSTPADCTKLSSDQVLAIKCAYADLKGSAEAHSQGLEHDWVGHLKTIQEIKKQFPFVK